MNFSEKDKHLLIQLPGHSPSPWHDSPPSFFSALDTMSTVDMSRQTQGWGIPHIKDVEGKIQKPMSLMVSVEAHFLKPIFEHIKKYQNAALQSSCKNNCQEGRWKFTSHGSAGNLCLIHGLYWEEVNTMM